MTIKRTRKIFGRLNHLLCVVVFSIVLVEGNANLKANAQQSPDPSGYQGGVKCVNAPPAGTRLRAAGRVNNGFSIVGVNLNRTFFPELKSRVFVPNFYLPRVATAWEGSSDAGSSPQQSAILTGPVTAERLTFDGSIGRFRLTRGLINIDARTACSPSA
jgi:hypothetical protein